MVFAPTSLAAVRTIADRLGPGRAAWQHVRFAEIDGVGRVTDTVGSVEADVFRGWSGTVVQPASVTMAMAVTMNSTRMGSPVGQAHRAIGQEWYHEGRVRPRKGRFAAAERDRAPRDESRRNTAG